MSRFRPSKNVLLLVGVLLLAAGVRYYTEGSYASAARHSLDFPLSPAEAQQLGVAAALAIVGALVGAAFGYRLNRTSAVILGAIGGALATAHYSSLIGALLGGPVGLLVALLTPRRIVVAALSCAAALAIGTAGGGIVGAMSEGPVPSAAWALTALMVAALAIAVGRLSRKVEANLKAPRRRVLMTLNHALLLMLAIVVGIPLGITLDSARRIQNLSGYAGLDWRPFDARVMTRGFIDVHHWQAAEPVDKQELARMTRFDGLDSLYLNNNANLHDDDLAVLATWPRISTLYLAGAPLTERCIRHVAALKWLQVLDLSDSEVTGAVLGQLPMRSQLTFLALNHTPAGDELLAQIPRFTTLMRLQINRTEVTDSGLAHLGRSRSLRSISLADTQVTDAGVKNLAAVPRLSVLDLSGTRVTDAGLPALAAAAGLRDIDLSRTQVTDAGLADLGTLASLSHLRLRDTRTTDAGVELLDDVPLLEWLDLQGTLVTDASVDLLARLPKLSWVNLTGTQVTPEGVHRLRHSSRNGVTVEDSRHEDSRH